MKKLLLIALLAFSANQASTELNYMCCANIIQQLRSIMYNYNPSLPSVALPEKCNLTSYQQALSAYQNFTEENYPQQVGCPVIA